MADYLITSYTSEQGLYDVLREGDYFQLEPGGMAAFVIRRRTPTGIAHSVLLTPAEEGWSGSYQEEGQSFLVKIVPLTLPGSYRAIRTTSGVEQDTGTFTATQQGVDSPPFSG
ncbi:MAG TPA: hypothetical protein VLQ45_10425 [Thermoanaerobaculia bacterium]|nr:hypothetical protein [Thermoanaerobaculia bacterium]